MVKSLHEIFSMHESVGVNLLAGQTDLSIGQERKLAPPG